MIPHPTATFLKPHGGAWIEVTDRPTVELVDYDDRMLSGAPRSPIVHLGRDAIWVWRERFIPQGGKVALWAQFFTTVMAVDENQAAVDSLNL